MSLRFAILATVVVSGLVQLGCAGAEAESSRHLMVSRGSLTPRVLMTGELVAGRAHSLAVPRTPTWEVQIRWMAEDGTEVVAGDRVVELDNTPFLTELEEKRLTLSQHKEELARKRAEGKLQIADGEFAVAQAEAGLEKARIAAAVPEALMARREFEELQLALRRAEIDLDKARESLAATRRRSESELAIQRIQVERFGRQIDLAENAVSSLQLTAPVDGILVVGNHPWEGRKLQVGDSVWVGMTVARIPDLTTMRVAADLPDVDDGRVAVGMKVRCTLDAYPQESFAGRVEQVAMVAKEASSRSLRRFFDVEVGLDEGDSDRMRPGMSVKVEVFGEERADALLAPRAALDLDAESPRARTPGGWREVDLGSCDAHHCEVTGGLSEGTRLAAVGEAW
ncbi:MAG: efflux RND transporter periplasmic adaptor subunit [Acidobacteriota bacterium]